MSVFTSRLTVMNTRSFILVYQEKNKIHSQYFSKNFKNYFRIIHLKWKWLLHISHSLFIYFILFVRNNYFTVKNLFLNTYAKTWIFQLDFVIIVIIPIYYIRIFHYGPYWQEIIGAKCVLSKFHLFKYYLHKWYYILRHMYIFIYIYI